MAASYIESDKYETLLGHKTAGPRAHAPTKNKQTLEREHTLMRLKNTAPTTLEGVAPAHDGEGARKIMSHVVPEAGTSTDRSRCAAGGAAHLEERIACTKSSTALAGELDST